MEKYICEVCGYAQDFEPTKELQDFHFNNVASYPREDLGVGECPSCKLRNNINKLVKVEA